MHIGKILKFYFFLTMFVTSVSIVSYAPTAKNHVATFFDDGAGRALAQENRLLTSIFPVPDTKKSDIQSEILNDFYTVNLFLNSDPSLSFANPGGQNIKIMNLVLKSFDADLELKSLVLTINGVSPSKIEKVYLLEGKNIIAETRPFNGYLRFPGISHRVFMKEDNPLVILVDLSPDLNSGERVRLDIEQPEHINVLTNGEKHSFSPALFPMKGPYMSIVRPRGE